MPEDTDCRKAASTGHLNSNCVLISLVIPCHNVPEDQIRRALASVRQQTFCDYEVIVVDDGSQEPFFHILQKLCAREDNITLIRKDNHGVSAARNTGMSVARGEYIAFLDADDVLADDFLERAWQAATEADADFVIGGVTVTDQPEQFLVSPRVEPIRYARYDSGDIKTLYHHFIGLQYRICFPNGYIGRGSWARLIRSELAKKTTFNEDLRIGEDIPWNLSILSQCRTVCIVNESWYGYWRNPDSASHRYDPHFIEACAAQLKAIAEIIDLTDDLLYDAWVDRVYEHLHMIWPSYLCRARAQDRSAYRNAVKHIFSEWPWTEFGSRRSLRLAAGKKRLAVILYRLHAFYGAKALKARLFPNK